MVVFLQMRLTVNAAPKDGSLVVSPASGYLLSTVFTLTGHNWTDAEENYPLSYAFLLDVSTPLRAAGSSPTHQVWDVHKYTRSFGGYVIPSAKYFTESRMQTLLTLIVNMG